jgi:hypothetical protein
MQIAVRCTLDRQRGSSAPSIGPAFDRLLEELDPLIGVRTGRILFRRSVVLTHRQFPWLDREAASDEDDSRFLRLQALLDEQAPEVADSAAETLLTTFVSLAALLLGESLLLRVLYRAWPECSDDLE